MMCLRAYITFSKDNELMDQLKWTNASIRAASKYYSSLYYPYKAYHSLNFSRAQSIQCKISEKYVGPKILITQNEISFFLYADKNSMTLQLPFPNVADNLLEYCRDSVTKWLTLLITHF